MLRPEHTLELSLRGAADAVLPEDRSVVDKGQPQLGLEVKVLPAACSHRWVEHVGNIKGHPQGHEGLDQVQYLQARRESQCSTHYFVYCLPH